MLVCDGLANREPGWNTKKNKPNKLRLSNSDNILKEIETLILKRKKIEKEFAILRKKLLQKKSITIDSSNWEEWKILSMEYDEIKKIIGEIDKRYVILKRFRHELKK